MPLSTDLMKKCEQCSEHSGKYALCDNCHAIWQSQSVVIPYFKEMGIENPIDPQGSTAHVRDIKARRYDFQEKRLFYERAPKTYFLPKG